jgi:hypothetical protein
LGIEHEHQRPDRDKFIRVKYENVESKMKGLCLKMMVICFRQF